MKLTKKLLTVLPLTTLGCITPIVVSGCSCGTSFEIKYGESVNCKDKNNKTISYHSIDEVKNASKSHIQPFDDIKLTDEQLADKWTDENKEFFYWDLIYSCANTGIEFILTWKDGMKLNDTSFTSLTYKFNNGKVGIYADGTKLLVNSYCLDKVTKA